MGLELRYFARVAAVAAAAEEEGSTTDTFGQPHKGYGKLDTMDIQVSMIEMLTTRYSHVDRYSISALPC